MPGPLEQVTWDQGVLTEGQEQTLDPSQAGAPGGATLALLRGGPERARAHRVGLPINAKCIRAKALQARACMQGDGRIWRWGGFGDLVSSQEPSGWVV